MRSQIARQVSKEMGMRAKDVRAATSIARGSVPKPVATITAEGRPLNLIRFKARQAKKWVRAKPWGRWVRHEGAWIGNNNRTVFIRTRRRSKGRAAGVRGSSITEHNQAIRPMWGPGVAKSVAQNTRTKQFRFDVKSRFDKEFESALEFQMNKLKMPKQSKVERALRRI